MKQFRHGLANKIIKQRIAVKMDHIGIIYGHQIKQNKQFKQNKFNNGKKIKPIIKLDRKLLSTYTWVEFI